MTSEQHKRGMRLLTTWQHNLQMHGWWRKPRGIHIGKSIIPERFLSEHFLITGSTGAGKSVLIRGLLHQIRDRGEGAIVLDPESEYVQEFYDEERGDVILNPLDARCPFWSPWLEFTADTIDSDVESLSDALVRGKPGDSSAEYFINGAKMVIEVLLKKTTSMAELLKLAAADPGQLHRVLKGTLAYHHVSAGGPAQSSAIMGTIGAALKPFEHLRENGERDWSARGWAHDPKGWIFLSSVEGSRAATRAIQAVWLDFLTRWLLSPDVHLDQRQIWIIADELPVLGKLAQIQSLATRGRKRGLALVMGFQNLSQLREIYGHEGSITLASAPTTKVIMRCDEPETARYGSDLLSNAEIIRTVENTSSGTNNSSTSRVQQHIENRIVMAAEIQLLPKLEGYLAVAGHHRTKVIVPPKFLEKKEPAFVPRATKVREIAVEPVKEEIPAEWIKWTKSSYKSAELRCGNHPENPAWKYYGGADPPVELLVSMDEIIADIGYRQSDELTLDRKNPNPEPPYYGHYVKGNLRWATDIQQRANRKRRVVWEETHKKERENVSA